jgi:hypothetical protein
MGGMLDPISQGEVDGRKQGVASDAYLSWYGQQLDLESRSSNYWLGFGAGYYCGQQERIILKRENAHLSLEQKAAFYLYLLNFSNFDDCNLATTYLENIQNWHAHQIPHKVCENALDILEAGEIQRAINEIGDYYRGNFALQARIEIDKLTQRLKNARQAKRENKDHDTTRERAAIAADLRAWVLKYGEQKVG